MSQPTLNTATIEAEKDSCWYLTRNEGKQVRCGEPATHRYPVRAGWFQVCELHARVVGQDRANKGLAISKIRRDDV